MTYLINSHRFAAATNVPSKSLDLDGSTDYLSMSDANFGSFDRAKFAIAGSFKCDALSGDHTIMSNWGGAGSRGWQLCVNSSGAMRVWVSTNGLNLEGQFVTANSTIATNTWYAFLVHVDTANGTSGDRIKIWLNNSSVSSSSYSAPTASAYNPSHITEVGSQNTGGGMMDGLIYSLAFFSGSLPSASNVFDDSSGKVKDLSGLTGLYSFLDIAGGSVIADAVKTPDWTNNGTVTSSSTIP